MRGEVPQKKTRRQTFVHINFVLFLSALMSTGTHSVLHEARHERQSSFMSVPREEGYQRIPGLVTAFISG